ncbi:MAG: hypothetical protein ACXWAT_00700 [Methylobacter sp.]
MKDVADKRWLREGEDRKWTEQDEQAIDGAFITVFKYIAGLLVLVFTISTLAASHAEPAKATEYLMSYEKLNKADRKLLVSHEIKSYMKRVSHARITDLGDVE